MGGYPLIAPIFALLLTFAPTSGHASSFDGLWVDELGTQMGKAGFDTYLVKGGAFVCQSCSPPRTFAADGKIHAIVGDPSETSESVTIAGPRTIVIREFGPEMTRVTTMSVAQDERTATYVSLDYWQGRAKPLRTEYVAKRVAPAPAGSLPVSGSWLGVRYVEVPVEYRSVRLEEKDGQLTRSNFRHGHYTASIGGPAVPVTGDGKSIYKAMVRAPDARTRVETILLNGTPVVERTYRLAPDGKSMLTTVRDPKDGSTFSTAAHRALHAGNAR